MAETTQWGLPGGARTPRLHLQQAACGAWTKACGRGGGTGAPTSTDTMCLALGTFRPGASCILVHTLRAVWAWLSLAQGVGPTPLSQLPAW